MHLSTRLLLGALLVLAACDADPSGAADPTSAVAGPAQLSAANGFADTAPTFDAVVNDVSLKHPGFKGIVGSDDGSQMLVLTDGAQSLNGGDLIEDLARALGTEPSAMALTALAPSTAARPDFHELYTVKSAMRRFLLAGDVVRLDLDEATGRVEVGVVSRQAQRAVEAQMTPAERASVDFVRARPAVSMVGTSASAGQGSGSTLRSLRFDAFRPLIGGAQIDFRQGTSGPTATCTQGPAVRYNNGSWGFLTNAHCTFDRTRVDGIAFHQPTITTANRIATETAEPAYRSGWFITDGYYSDIAYARAQNGIGLQGKMTSADGCTINGSDCRENGIINSITGTASYVTVNVRVYKTGATTGSTSGKVTDMCEDHVVEGGHKILCSNVVTWDSSFPQPSNIVYFGDSGSPVLVSQGQPGSNQGPLTGVLWGKPSGTNTQFIYSPWENIWQQERAGSNYGLPVAIVRAPQGTVTNTSTGGGGGGGGGGCEPFPEPNAQEVPCQ